MSRSISDKSLANDEPFPPQLAKVFSALRKGKHISIEDGVEFRDLQQHQDRYAAVLDALGYKLVKHHQNFFYLKGGNDLNTKGLRSVALFLLILFQHLEDSKFDDAQRSWEKNLLDRTFVIADLPHFETPARRSLMFSLDLTSENLRERVLRTMYRLGFISFVGQSQFRFRSPVYRFVEVCLNYAEVESESKVLVELVNDSAEQGSTTSTTTNEEEWEDVDDEAMVDEDPDGGSDV